MRNVTRLVTDSISSGGIVKTDSGFLRVPIRATRVGIFEYVQPDGSIRKELRPPEEVFAQDSLDTLAGVPLTELHPNQLVTVENVNTLSVGMIGDTVEKVESRFVDVIGTVTNKRSVEKLEAKKDAKENQEVSCGYTATMDFTPGIFQGEKYDAVQRNIRYNHVAFVPQGRAGKDVRVKLDENDNAIYDNKVTKGADPMEKITIDGVEHEVSTELAKAITNVQGQLTTAKNDAESMKKKMEEDEEELKKSKKDKDELQAKKDQADVEIASLKKAAESTKLDANKLDALADERANIVSIAAKINPDFKKDGKSNMEIKKETIALMFPDLKMDGLSDDYITSRFDAISEGTGQFIDHLKEAMLKKDEKDKKQVKVDSAAARKKMVQDSKEAWTKPLNA